MTPTPSPDAVGGPAADRTPSGGVPILGPRLRLLFVDDEPRLLEGLRRMLHPLRHAWDMRFLGDGTAALAEMEREPADVVVSDMGMPVMNGAQLLATVIRRWPATIRIILSGHAELDLVQRTIGPTHQFLQKPCDAVLLKATVSRAERLRTSLAGDTLRELVGSQETLPSLPHLYLELVEQMHTDPGDMRRIGELVGSDLGMAARVLQLVNSAFFGCRRTVANPADAVALLGFDTLQALVLTTHAFDRLGGSLPPGFDADRLWRHSARVALMAKRIARAIGLTPMQAEESSIAGMLHDTGHLLLATRQPGLFLELDHRIHRDHLPMAQVERLLLGSTHGEIGAYLLGLWGISDPIVEAVAWHHEPFRHQGRSALPLTCVHVADALVHLQDGDPHENPLSREHCVAIGLPTDADAWHDLLAGTEGGAP